jgi:hypothetical protein
MLVCYFSSSNIHAILNAVDADRLDRLLKKNMKVSENR